MLQLVAVELPVNAVDLTMEEIGEAPEQVLGVVLQAGVGEDAGEYVDRVGDRGVAAFGFRQRPVVGLVLAGAGAVEGKFVEQMGEGGASRFKIGVGDVHGGVG